MLVRTRDFANLKMTRLPHSIAPSTAIAIVPGGLGCIDCKSNGMGNLIGGFSLQTVALLAGAGLIGYHLFFGGRAKARRRELAGARAEYRKRVADIRSRYPRL